jgi:hypothetical protein
MRDACKTIQEIFVEADLLPTAEWRNFMGSKDISKLIESEEVRALVREREGQLATW